MIAMASTLGSGTGRMALGDGAQDVSRGGGVWNAVPNCGDGPTVLGSGVSGFCTVTDGRQFEREGVALYYEVLGGGPGSPLVVLNGGPGVDHTYMHCSDVWHRLAASRPVLMYDPRGTGRSTGPAEGPLPTFRDQIEDLEALLGHLGWDAVDLLGHSFGGNVAMAYLARYGDCLRAADGGGCRARRLVLVDSGPPKLADEHMLFEKVYPEATEQWADLDFGFKMGDDEAIRQTWMVYFTMLFYSPEKRDAYMENASADGANSEINEAVWEDAKRYDMWPQLPKLRLPVLVTTGRFDANVAPSVAYAIHKAIPDSRFVAFERSGHMPFYEEPDAFEALVQDFLTCGRDVD